jgi:Polyketide synthase dehydratase
VRFGEGEALGRVELPSWLTVEAAPYVVHPALLDACFQVLGAAVFRTHDSSETYLPFAIERLTLVRRPPSALWVRASLRATDDASATIAGDLEVRDEAGRLVARVAGLSLRQAGVEQLEKLQERAEPLDPDLLGEPLKPAADAPTVRRWERDVGQGASPFPILYRQPEGDLVPMAAFAEMALAAAREALPNASGWRVQSLEMHEPLVLAADAGRVLQAVLSSESALSPALRVYSRSLAHGPAWSLHATARMGTAR